MYPSFFIMAQQQSPFRYKTTTFMTQHSTSNFSYSKR